MKVTRKRIGGLDVIEALAPGEAHAPLTAVILHGYGASMDDLAPLAGMIAPPGSRWVFPNGPVEVPLGPFYSGRAWFPIDIEAFQRAALAGTHRDLSTFAPPELVTSREAVLQLLRAVDTPLERVVLGGFSQGAMLATDIALHLPFSPAGMLLWSGTLLQEALWAQLAPARAGMRYVQSHGRRDPVLSFAGAERLARVLRDAGWQGRFVAFDGGHEVPPPVLEASRELLADLARTPAEVAEA